MIGTLCWICGGIGALAFATCSLPQVIKAFKTKSTKDISLFFIILSIIGNVFSAIYIFYTNYIMNYWQIPQYVNYGTAVTLIVILMFLKIKYDKTVDKETKQITKELDVVYETLINSETVEESDVDEIEEQEEIIEDETPIEEEPVEVDEKFELFKDKINKIKIPVYSEDALRNSTIYARQQWLNYRSAMMDMINEPIDEYRLTRPILDRWEVNYIKEKLTNYNDLLNEVSNTVGKNNTYKKINNLVLDKISETYPFLKNECQQQKM